MKIKLNWGYGLMLGMTAFIAFIMYFVISMLSSKKYDHDLVVEDYYGAELHYQQDIDATKNAFALEKRLEIIRDGDQLFIELPPQMDLSEISGIVTLYRPSNKKLAFSISLENLQDHRLEIPKKQLVPGRWNINVCWNYQEKEYLVEKQMIW